MWWIFPPAIIAGYQIIKTYSKINEAKDTIDNVNRKLEFYQSRYRVAKKELKNYLMELETIYDEVYSKDFQKFKNILTRLNKNLLLKEKEVHFSEDIKIESSEIRVREIFLINDTLSTALDYLFTADEILTEAKELEREGMFIVAEIQNRTLEIKELIEKIKQYKNYFLEIRERFLNSLQELENINTASQEIIDKKIKTTLLLAKTLRELMDNPINTNMKL